MDDKKEVLKNSSIVKPFTKSDIHKRNETSFKNSKPKSSMKKIARSRNQKGHKNY